MNKFSTAIFTAGVVWLPLSGPLADAILPAGADEPELAGVVFASTSAKAQTEAFDAVQDVEIVGPPAEILRSAAGWRDRRRD